MRDGQYKISSLFCELLPIQISHNETLQFLLAIPWFLLCQSVSCHMSPVPPVSKHAHLSRHQRQVVLCASQPNRHMWHQDTPAHLKLYLIVYSTYFLHLTSHLIHNDFISKLSPSNYINYINFFQLYRLLEPLMSQQDMDQGGQLQGASRGDCSTTRIRTVATVCTPKPPAHPQSRVT